MKLIAWEAALVLGVWLVYQWANWGQRFTYSDVLFMVGALELAVASGDAMRSPMIGVWGAFVRSGPAEPGQASQKMDVLNDLMENHSLAVRLITSGLLTMLIAVIWMYASR